MGVTTAATVTPIGDFDISELEKPYQIEYELNPDRTPNTNKPLPATNTNELGMMYRSTAGVSKRAKELGDQLKDLTEGKDPSGGTTTKLEVDNPLVLARITAASGNYNMARQLQSNLMKSIKDTAQAIGRNV